MCGRRELGFLGRASDGEVGVKRAELRFEDGVMGVMLSISRFSRRCRPGDFDFEREVYFVRATDLSDSFVATIKSSRSGHSMVSFPADEDKEICQKHCQKWLVFSIMV